MRDTPARRMPRAQLSAALTAGAWRELMGSMRFGHMREAR